jgi:hypothetical protein
MRMPMDAAGRAVRLLTACDPHSQLAVHADSDYI